MEYRELGSTELQVSSIGMGCVTFGREIDKDSSFTVLDHAFERGINLLDTAEAYAAGESERVVGEWMELRGVRDKLVLATKYNGTMSRETIQNSIDESLTRLRTDRIDLFQLHNWDCVESVEETMQTLDGLVKAGKVQAIGCSNWNAWQLAKSMLYCQREGLTRFQSVQPPYNLVQREIEADLLPLCHDQQVGVLAYSPLAAGFLTGKYKRDGEVPTGTRFDVIPGHQPIYFTDHGYAVLERLEKCAKSSVHSMVQLALAWTISRPYVTSVLIGARNTGHVDQAFAAENIELDHELNKQLSGVQ